MNITESLNVEFKRDFIEEIKNEIIAFLNTNGGTIYVGVNDDKSIYEPFTRIERNSIDLKIGNWMEMSIYPSTFGLINYFYLTFHVLNCFLPEVCRKRTIKYKY